MGVRTRIEKAQDAYDTKDMVASKKAHLKKTIVSATEEHTQGRGQYLGDLVFGALDGIITTFAVVSGVQGAKLDSSVVLILGFANLFGDGLSMALGNYLSTKSEMDYMKREREREMWEIENVPEGEVEEIKQIFMKKGFFGKDLARAVKIVTSDKKVWVETMMHEELKLQEENKTPVKSAIATFIAFSSVGVVPLLAFILALGFPFLAGITFPVSIVLTTLALFTVGALRTYVTGLKWYRSGFEMLFVGSIAAIAAYSVGFLLRSMGI